jgi:peptide deformylase
VLNPSGDRKDRSGERVLCNPKITKKKGREFGEEGCLSFPGIQADVERWVAITVTYQDLDGKEQVLETDGWLARIVQHELDHLEGVLFVDRLTAADKLRVKAQLQQLEEDYRAGNRT